MKKRAAPKSIDQYLSGLDDKPRRALEKLRKDIKTAAPAAEECISYRIPAFRLHGRLLVWFHAASRHCSFFPGAHPIHVHTAVLKKYSISKGTIRFDPDAPLPSTLVKKLVKARIEALSEL